MNKKMNYTLFLLFLIAGLYNYTFAANTFDLSYNLTEGGLRLELNQANPYKGVKIEINSNESIRYEVIQRIIKPLENRDNPGLVIRENLVFHGLRGTNKFGDLRVPVTDSPLGSEEVLYVSNPAGDADSFTLAYGLNRIEEIEPGYYFGRIGFILRPIDSTKTAVTKILDVYIRIPKEEIKSYIEISTTTGSKTITLNPKKEDKQTTDVLVKINGKFKRLFNIIQFLTQPFESKEGYRLDYEGVNFVVKEAKEGVAINRPTILSQGPQIIYTSRPDGQADDYFIISYNIGDLSKQRAGRYSSRIQYFLEQDGRQTRLETLQIEIENEHIFDLIITPQEQRYAIEFRDLKPTEPFRQSQVIIEIMTNLGKQYQVNQELYSELTNKEGDIIPLPYLTLYTESLDTKGKLRASSPQEVKKGSTVLFISDSQGLPDKFKVVYELACPKDLKAGDYSTRITYSLSEI